MKRVIGIGILLVFGLVVMVNRTSAAPTQPQQVVTVTVTPSEEPTSPTPSPSESDTPSPSTTMTPEPSASPTPSPSWTASIAPSPSPTPSWGPTPTPSPSWWSPVPYPTPPTWTDWLSENMETILAVSDGLQNSDNIGLASYRGWQYGLELTEPLDERGQALLDGFLYKAELACEQWHYHEHDAALETFIQAIDAWNAFLDYVTNA